MRWPVRIVEPFAKILTACHGAGWRKRRALCHGAEDREKPNAQQHVLSSVHARAGLLGIGDSIGIGDSGSGRGPFRNMEDSFLHTRTLFAQYYDIKEAL